MNENSRVLGYMKRTQSADLNGYLTMMNALGGANCTVSNAAVLVQRADWLRQSQGHPEIGKRHLVFTAEVKGLGLIPITALPEEAPLYLQDEGDGWILVAPGGNYPGAHAVQLTLIVSEQSGLIMALFAGEADDYPQQPITDQVLHAQGVLARTPGSPRFNILSRIQEDLRGVRRISVTLAEVRNIGYWDYAKLVD